MQIATTAVTALTLHICYLHMLMRCLLYLVSSGKNILRHNISSSNKYYNVFLMLTLLLFNCSFNIYVHMYA